MISEEIEKRLQAIEEFVNLPKGVTEPPEGKVSASFGGPLIERPEVKEEGVETDELLRKMEDLINSRLSDLTSDVYEIINEYFLNENNFTEIFRRYIINTSPQIRRAFVKTTPGAVSTVRCYLDVDGSGPRVTVNCSITGGSALNAAVRRIVDGDDLQVVKVGNSWYALEGFQAISDGLVIDTELKLNIDTDHFQFDGSTPKKLRDKLDTCPLG